MSDKPLKNIGNSYRDIRRERKIPISFLAKAVSMTKKEVENFEEGEDIKVDKLLLISRYLKVKPSTFLIGIVILIIISSIV